MLKSKTYFPGLNALRFFAASFVVIQHIQDNQLTQGLPHLPEYAMLNKGVTAVTFFFTLSGFLITYLLLGEYHKNGNINVFQFYIRRALRIWPLYFVIVSIGLLLYWVLLPALSMNTKTEYPLFSSILYYVFMMPNVANQYFQVGGILIVLWSIGVEEQFYLFWAPLMKVFKNNILEILLVVFWASLFVHMLNHHHLFDISAAWQRIISELQFHYMAAGGILAFGTFFYRDNILRLAVFSNKAIQWVLLSLIVIYFLLIPDAWLGEMFKSSVVPFLFAWLIVNVSINPRRAFSTETKAFDQLGKISYGIYMYHMVVIYAVSFIMGKFNALHTNFALFQLIYHIVVFAISTTIAYYSYQYFEKQFLKRRQYFQGGKPVESLKKEKTEINYNIKGYDTI